MPETVTNHDLGRANCPHCDSASFESQGWHEDEEHGRVNRVRCDNCLRTFDIAQEN